LNNIQGNLPDFQKQIAAVTEAKIDSMKLRPGEFVTAHTIASPPGQCAETNLRSDEVKLVCIAAVGLPLLQF
jgi:hypothetical protein